MGQIYWSYEKKNGKNPLGDDITSESRLPWELQDCHYLVMGDHNAELTETMGVKRKNIHLVSHEKNLVPHSSINPLYNKVYLMQKSMEMFDEILYIDFDSLSTKPPDEAMWDRLYRKAGRFNGSFMAPIVKRRFKQLLTKDQGGFRVESDDLCFIINTCLVYCNDKNWVDQWLAHFEKYRDDIGEDITKRDEYILMYYLDKEIGPMSIQETIDNFDTDIVLTHHKMLNMLEDQVYFRHLSPSKFSITV